MSIFKKLLKLVNINDEYSEINDTIDQYATIHGVISDSINRYEDEVDKIAKEHEYKFQKRSNNPDFHTKEYVALFKNIETLMLTNIKEKYIEMREFGLVLDNIVESFIEKNGAENVLKVFGHKQGKHSIVDFNEYMLKDQNVEIIDFPSIPANENDIDVYAKRMRLLLVDIENAKINIKRCNDILNGIDQNDPLFSIIDKMKSINISNLSTFELDFVQEIKITKTLVDKTLNFLELPFDISEKNVTLNVYLRKLVDTGFFNSSFYHKRFTNSIPTIMLPYEDEIGFYVTNIQKEVVNTGDTISSYDENDDDDYDDYDD